MTKTLLPPGSVSRRAGLMSLAIAGCALLAAGTAGAQAQSAAEAYPSKLVTILVGFGPGGASDVTARILADQMFKDRGAKVIVENKPGAAGRLAAENFVKQPADGHTLMVAGNAVVSIAKVIYPKLGYDPVGQLKPISIVADFPTFILVVAANHPAKNFAELVEWSKQNPAKSNYPTPGPSYTIPTEQLKQSAGLQGVAVSYRSGNEALTSVITGETTYMLADPASARSLLESGKLRALAVSGEHRFAQLKDIPTLDELGHKVTMRLWTGLFAPAGTPDDVVAKIQQEVRRVVNLPDVAARLRNLGLEPGGNTPAEYRDLIAREVKDYTATVKAAGLVFEE